MKKKLGIRARVFLEIGAIITACILILTFLNSRILESVYLWNAERELRSISQKTESISDGSYQAELSDYEASLGVSIYLYDKDDNYLYESRSPFISGKRLWVIKRTENSDGSYFSILSEEGSQTQYILYGKDFDDGKHIEITSQKDPIQENAALATRVTTTVSIAALLFSLVFISLYAKRFTKPLIKMSEVTEKMSGLDFSEKLDIKRNDEIGALSQNINKLSASLDTALTELKTTNESLKEDILREQAIDKMQKEFTSSASHELKTPIAIIRGYAEALSCTLSENPEALEYCDIIINEADKMNSLVLNMLEASLYSSGVNKPQKVCFSLNGFISSFMKRNEPIFKEKGINAVCELSCDCLVFGDEKQLETVLSNLVSNACSHASGEKLLKVSADTSKEKAVVSVYNSGSFVDDRDKDNIFKSFYRADKAHSRKEGHFGLGLAIVKSITELHGTQCGFKNEEDGVTFFFEIEKYGGADRISGKDNI